MRMSEGIIVWFYKGLKSPMKGFFMVKAAQVADELTALFC